MKPEAGQLGGQADPLIDKLSKLAIVFQLLLNFRQILLADKLACTFSMTRQTDLIIRAVLEGRRGLASATGIAADIVLLRQSARAQVAQGRQLLLDVLDSLFEVLPGFHDGEHCGVFHGNYPAR